MVPSRRALSYSSVVGYSALRWRGLSFLHSESGIRTCPDDGGPGDERSGFTCASRELAGAGVGVSTGGGAATSATGAGVGGGGGGEAVGRAAASSRAFAWSALL